MNFIGNKRTRVKQNVITSANLLDLFPHDLQMYKIPPTDDITIMEIEDICLERIQLLRILELATTTGHITYSNDWKDFVLAEVAKAGLKKYLKLLKSSGASHPTESDLQARRIDNTSHFILRITYCRSEDLKRWFIDRELELFKLRFGELSPEGVNNFLKINNFTYAPISAEEKENIREELINSIFNLHSSNFDKFNVYKVRFTEVYSLVKNRKCYVHQGYAYILSSDLVTCILTSYRIHLNEALARNFRALPLINEERLNDLLPYLHTTYVGKSYVPSDNHEAINIKNLDQHAKENYPMCMRNIHEHFRANHHIRHGSRLQYGFFIKGIGVKYEDAMNFWRDEFTKLIDANKFEKQYAYIFKHQYGKVGNMRNYTPYSCMKIISSSALADDINGCPFKHWESNMLKQKLTFYGLSAEAIEDIMDKASKGHYQVACSKYFEYIHKQPSKNVINHPNQYFEESIEIYKGRSNNVGPSK